MSFQVNHPLKEMFSYFKQEKKACCNLSSSKMDQKLAGNSDLCPKCCFESKPQFDDLLNFASYSFSVENFTIAKSLSLRVYYVQSFIFLLIKSDIGRKQASMMGWHYFISAIGEFAPFNYSTFHLFFILL